MDGNDRGTVVQPLAEAINAHQSRLGLTSRRAMAAKFKLGVVELTAWCSGRKFPAKKYWSKLIEAGICTEFELSAWRPRRLKRYSLRGVKLIPLAEYASRYKPTEAVRLNATQKAG